MNLMKDTESVSGFNSSEASIRAGFKSVEAIPSQLRQVKTSQTPSL